MSGASDESTLAKVENIVNEQKTDRDSAASVIRATLALSIGYAVLRYNIVGPVPWTEATNTEAESFAIGEIRGENVAFHRVLASFCGT
jgi:hypothetical protein